jgi:hypothetical protein
VCLLNAFVNDWGKALDSQSALTTNLSLDDDG